MTESLDSQPSYRQIQGAIGEISHARRLPKIPILNYSVANSVSLSVTTRRPYPIPATLLESPRLKEAKDTITKLSTLRDGWDSYDAPAPCVEAIQTSAALLEELSRQNRIPRSILPSTQGGVVFDFIAGDRYAAIEIWNDDGITVLTASRGTSPHTVPLADGDGLLRAAIDQAFDYLNR